MEGLDKLIEHICRTSYKRSFDGGSSYNYVVGESEEERTAITQAVYEWGSEHITDFEKDKKLGELEAKCFAYEKFISNSNFAPMVIKDDTADIQKLFDEMRIRLDNVAIFNSTDERGVFGKDMCQHDEVMKIVDTYRDSIVKLAR